MHRPSRSMGPACLPPVPAFNSTRSTSESAASPSTAWWMNMETRVEALEIAVDDDRIAGTLLAPATTMPGVLFVHGWGGSQAQDLARARAAAGLGCVCLTFDLRGHARYEVRREMVTREENLRDLVAAYDLLAGSRGIDPASIAVVG